jgi:hypothetical protein
VHAYFKLFVNDKKDVGSPLESLRREDASSVVEVSDIHATSIFREK